MNAVLRFTASHLRTSLALLASFHNNVGLLKSPRTSVLQLRRTPDSEYLQPR